METNGSISKEHLISELEKNHRQMHKHKIALSALRTRRNELIRQLHQAGMSERQIAKVASVSSAFVNEVRQRLRNGN